MKLLNAFVVAIAASAMLSTLVQAGEETREERLLSSKEIARLIDAGMHDRITENNVELVSAMLNPKIGDSLNKTLNLDLIAEELFEGAKPSIDGNCYDSRFDLKKCEMTAGEAAGKGAYAKLAFASDKSKTSLRYAKRSDAVDLPKPVKLSDAEAYKGALSLAVETFGVSEVEIPRAPAKSKNPYPVKTVNLATSKGKGVSSDIPVQKLVTIQRGLYVEKLGWIPGPGRLSVSFNSDGLNAAALRSWADMSEYGHDIDPRKAKSRAELVEELTTLFQKEGVAKLDSARSLLAVSLPTGAESPIPVLRVFASAQPSELSEKEQANVVSSAGVVFEIPLVASDDAMSSSDDN
ncbi:hypothetical protein SAMN02745866_03406 [Alteromonadaceae bacterium Bs31]|nr:hypothetical protein SAMN02745866_03406 [Alteromonadaceae bacterium Bs31]